MVAVLQALTLPVGLLLVDLEREARDLLLRMLTAADTQICVSKSCW
jgi:hypothetical protein